MELAEEVKSILESELNLDSMKLNACQGDHSQIFGTARFGKL